MRIINALLPVFNESRLCHIKNHSRTLVILSNLLSNDVTITDKKIINKRNIMDSPPKNSIFMGDLDRYHGITVQSEKENCNSNEFSKKLNDSLAAWKDSGKRGIWFKVHLNQSEWVPILVKNGFKFHHAQEEFVMLYLWLPQNENCNVPNFAHTMVGVGAVVINDKSEILVVSERHFYGPVSYWKLPGGYVEPGENIVDAAIRECWEETNISTEFQSLLTLRQTHHGMFGCSDIYTVVSLKPLTQTIEKCDREIADCKWMAIDEYLNHPKVHDLNRFFVQKHLEYTKQNIKIDCYHGIHQIIDKPYTVYHVTKSGDEQDQYTKDLTKNNANNKL